MIVLRLEHIVSFADAIFAFSITFMAISIDIPNLAQNLTQTQVIDKLLAGDNTYQDNIT
jgi:uncharacterized membrane protein